MSGNNEGPQPRIMMEYYILDDNDVPVPVYDVLTWARWFEKNKDRRRVASTLITPEILVSTVFLGLDHAFYGGPPIIYETMVFDGREDEGMWRYSTRSEAIIGHKKAVEQWRKKLKAVDDMKAKIDV